MTKPIQIKDLVIGSGIPKVCVPLTGRTQKEILEEAQAAVLAETDLVEWRADFYEQLSENEQLTDTLEKLSGILGQIPLLFTIRTKKEGGNRIFSLKDYVNYNEIAAASGKADLVDVEIFGQEPEKRALIESLQAAGAVVIGSSHDFEKTDSREELLARYQEMEQSGADILKMAVMPKEFGDVAALMQVTNTMRKEYTKKPLIAMSMGNVGSISRISGENFGSSVTFATVGKASAPGQFPIRELRMMLRALHEKNAE